jgi:hypothetical protein
MTAQPSRTMPAMNGARVWRKGVLRTVNLIFNLANGDPWDLAGADLYIEVRDQIKRANVRGDLIATASVDNTDANVGKFAVTFSSTEDDKFTVGQFLWDGILKEANGAESPILPALFEVILGVTDPSIVV